ncbi:MAG: hypothetical protein ACRD8Z_01195 [Nitrososphaeraceae archaeon]
MWQSANITGCAAGTNPNGVARSKGDPYLERGETLDHWDEESAE